MRQKSKARGDLPRWVATVMIAQIAIGFMLMALSLKWITDLVFKQGSLLAESIIELNAAKDGWRPPKPLWKPSVQRKACPIP